ncbi:PCC domain-containing protein [Amaricoccus sp. W119]|uniref:PCC domain-containing protein n=1 Tax=Amaricoccus sp. W119 TaxID=3391833 RepID=UPI0039A6762A
MARRRPPGRHGSAARSEPARGGAIADWARLTSLAEHLWFNRVENAFRAAPEFRVGHGAPAPHVHVVLGRRDGSALAGHLKSGEVRPTLEIIVTETPSHLRRTYDATTGLTLIQF